MRYAYTGVSKSSHPPTSSKPTLVDHIHLLHVGVELGTTVCATSHLTLHHTPQSRDGKIKMAGESKPMQWWDRMGMERRT